jgi:hypothetical protein
MAFGQYATALRAHEVSPARRLAWAVNILDRDTAQRLRHLITTEGLVAGRWARLH